MSKNEISLISRFRGCLLGGAVGDALGAAVEFDSLDEIRDRFGSSGLADYAPAYGRLGAITDDTQMTLFTAEGMLREAGPAERVQAIYQSYLGWLYTQEHDIDAPPGNKAEKPDGWLVDVPELNEPRAAGLTCLSALQSGRMGTTAEPLNDSKGCGGVMRSAPIGLIGDDPFGLGRDAAAITHGHAAGYLSSGVAALVIGNIVKGLGLAEAIEDAVYRELPTHAEFDETFAALDRAIKLAKDKTVVHGPKIVEAIGEGWVGEEALAIALYCSMVHENDFRQGVLLAVNHSGDSDSTGAITGNILGALLGIDAIPRSWLKDLEIKEVIDRTAVELFERKYGASQ